MGECHTINNRHKHARACRPGTGKRPDVALLVHRHAQTTQRGGGHVGPCDPAEEATGCGSAPGPPRLDQEVHLHSSTGEGQSGNQAPAQGCGTSRPPEGLWTEQAQKTSSRGAAFGKALKAKETGRCPRQRSLGIRGHCFRQEQTVRAGSSVAGLSQWSLCSHKTGAGLSSQALTARGGAGRVIRVQGAEPKVRAL